VCTFRWIEKPGIPVDGMRPAWAEFGVSRTYMVVPKEEDICAIQRCCAASDGAWSGEIGAGHLVK